MDSLLSKFTGTSRASASKKSGSKSVSPIKKTDFRRRVELLDSFEEAGLGWFWATDAEGRLTYLSEKATDLLKIAQEDVLGRPLLELFAADDSEDEEERSERSLSFLLGTRNTIAQLPVKLVAEEVEYWWELTGKPQFDDSEDRNFLGFRGSAKDITASIGSRRDVERMSQYDSLTGLANRHRMTKQLDKVLAAFRVAKRSCALIMIDLDRFKQVNDTLGHPAGDELLRQVSQRLQSLIGKKGEIGRLGGDEFQIILPDVDDRGTLGNLSQRIVQMISQPYSVNGSRAIIGCSVGIAIAPYDGLDSEELVRSVDLALYAAKNSGRGQHRFYSRELMDVASYRRNIEEDLRDALVHDQLVLKYQPIVNSKNNQVEAVEALMRWKHPARGWVSPGDFIPIAEELGLIIEIGEWALNQACIEAQSWPEEIRVAVNCSAVQFASDGFVQVVKRALQNSGIDPSRVELEITESVFVGDLERTLKMFKKLKALGVRLSLDDFGTGYSSLSYLRNAPFDKIKIDQSFVHGCTEKGNNNAALITAIVSLATALKMDTVAEGIETKDELSLINSLGPSHLQGAIFAFAITQEELVEKLESGDLSYEPRGPARYRAERRTEFRKIGLVHDDYRYDVVLRNLSKSGAKIEGLLDVPVGTEVVLDLGEGQWIVAVVRRSHAFSQGVEFEQHLISDGNDGLCTRHRVSPYQIEAVGRPLAALSQDAFSLLMGTTSKAGKAFVEVDLTQSRP